MSSFTPRSWKSQSAPEAEHRTEAPVEPPHPRDVVERSNLPIASTAFIGREHDVAEVKELLDRHRLVTLVGSGGVGKTRLALQVVLQGNMAELEFADGYPDQALRAVTEALDIQLRGKNAAVIANSHCNSAAYRIALGDLFEARVSAREGLRAARQARHEALIVAALQHLALLTVLGGDARGGAQLLGYVDAQYSVLGMQRQPTEQWGYDKLMSTLREKLTADEIAALEAEGATWSEDRAVEEALKA